METIGPILVTGGGAPGSAGILKALKAAYPSSPLYSCDMQQDTVGSLLADHYFTVYAGDTAAYVEDLLHKCTKRRIKKILPITTKEVAALAAKKELFAKHGITVIVSSSKALHVANDKGTLYSKLQQNHIATPLFRIVNNLAEAEEAIHYFETKNKPFITKPCVGNGSRGFRILNQNVSPHDLLFNHKPSSTHISSSSLLDALSERPFPPILMSEYMPGKEYTVDCLIDHGVPKLIIPRSRDKMNNGISVAGEIVHNKEIISYCQAILAQFKFHGPIGIQVKLTANNKPLIVEINPRIQGTTVACQGAGVNIAALCVSNDLSAITMLNNYPIKWGVKFIRHYSEQYYS